MKVYSGNYYMCDTGIPTHETDMHGHALYTGDIVQLWHGNWIGEDFEEWLPSSGLTVIVANQYESYTNGTFTVLTENPIPFTMGISSIGVQGGEWKVSLVKSHKDIVLRERIISFGFNIKQ